MTATRECSCTSYCRGSEGLAKGFHCGREHPTDYDAAMKLPPNMTCAQCIHYSRCAIVLGCTTAERTSCDFYPNKFIQRTEPATLTPTP